jgi:two-component system NtrC family sensor kinase
VSPDPAPGRAAARQDFPYYRRTWARAVAVLLGAALLPLTLLGGGLYLFADRALERRAVAGLTAEVRDHRRAIDAHLVERRQDLSLVAASLPDPRAGPREDLAARLAALHASLPCFVDLGVIGADGRHRAYDGPYDLLDRDYGAATWFRQVMATGTVVSDVFLGHRGEPHFVVALRCGRGADAWIVRGTVRAAPFRDLVSVATGHPSGDGFLVDRQGRYQTLPRAGGDLMAPSGLGAPPRFEGVRLLRRNGTLAAGAWLEEVPWLCLVQVDRREVFADLHRVRNVAAGAALLGAALVVGAVLLVTGRLVRRLESDRRSLRFLDRQLRRASLQVSSVQLCGGLLEELKAGLARADMAAVWAREQLGGRDGAACLENLARIRAEAARGRSLLERFQALATPAEAAPAIGDVDLHGLLDDLLDLLEGEFYQRRIEVVRDYAASLPTLRADRARLRQVFQSVLLNAAEAAEADGVVRIVTRGGEGLLEASVIDSGPGIAADCLVRVFEPLYTTRPDGVGLGLSVSRSILESMGGRITAANEPGLGARITIRLPLRPVLAGR